MIVFLLQHLDEDVQKLDSQIEGVITEGDKISQQLEDSDPSESLRIQAEVEHLKVCYLKALPPNLFYQYVKNSKLVLTNYTVLKGYTRCFFFVAASLKSYTY